AFGRYWRKADIPRCPTCRAHPLYVRFRALVRYFAARFDPAGTVAAVSTRESIGAARAYHNLAKFQLATVGGDLARPFIAAAGCHDHRIPLHNRFSNADKRVPDHGL